MRFLNKKLYPLQYALTHTKTSVENQDYDIKFISDAPKLVRLFSRGNYCAFGTTIYVPNMHLELAQSTHNEDKSLATAKLLPFMMLLHDNDTITWKLFFRMLLDFRYQVHYFIYEFLLLKQVDHKFKDTILLGFLSTRKSLFLRKKLSTDLVAGMIDHIFKSNMQS